MVYIFLPFLVDCGTAISILALIFTLYYMERSIRSTRRGVLGICTCSQITGPVYYLRLSSLFNQNPFSLDRQARQAIGRGAAAAWFAVRTTTNRSRRLNCERNFEFMTKKGEADLDEYMIGISTIIICMCCRYFQNSESSFSFKIFEEKIITST